MDIKNIIAAISLSALVLILYSLFFAPPPPDLNEQKNKIENTKNNSDISSPKIEKKVETKVMSRDSALDLSERIKIENNNIIGSISLKGTIWKKPESVRLFSSIKEKNLPGWNDFSQSTGLEIGSTVIFLINFASTLLSENNSKEKARKNIK